MVRPNKDKFIETSYAFRKGTEHRLVSVSLPEHSKITYKVKISEDLNGKAIYGTTDELIRTSHYTEDEIKKLFREKNAIVTKIEKATTQLPNFCERCTREGVPIIQKKSNYDNRLRTRTDSPKRSNRPDEYRWIYQHKEGKKMCIIATFDVANFRFIKPTNRTSVLNKHFFPRYLEKMKKELDISDFFQKFTNVSHA